LYGICYVPVKASKMNTPGPEHKLLNDFAGRWKTTGLIKAANGNPEIYVHGYDSYEWWPGSFFLVHKVDVFIGDDRNETIEIISFDKSTNSYRMQHFDNKGGSGMMNARFDNNTWRFQGETLRFRGGFNENKNVFSGTWEHLEGSRNWSHFMDIRLEKEA
jgi:hypothetical protein